MTQGIYIMPQIDAMQDHYTAWLSSQQPVQVHMRSHGCILVKHLELKIAI